MVIWRVFGNSEMARFAAELWMTGDETEWSFVGRQRTEPFSLVSGYGCLLRPFLYSGDDLVRGFVPNSDC